MENFTFCAVFIKKGLAHLFPFSFSENVSSSKEKHLFFRRSANGCVWLAERTTKGRLPFVFFTARVEISAYFFFWSMYSLKKSQVSAKKNLCWSGKESSTQPNFFHLTRQSDSSN